MANAMSYDIWHSRLGHLNETQLQQLQSKGMVHMLRVSDKPKSPCEVCLKAKQARPQFPKVSATRSHKLLEVVHTDICGPMRKESFGRGKYFATFIDDKSRYVVVTILKKRSDIFAAFQQYKEMAERQTGHKLKVLRSDNALEYTSHEFTSYLRDNGIVRQLTAEYTPQQNGVAERANRTLVEMVRCFLEEGKLPEGLWAELVTTAAYIRNRCPTQILDKKTPQEVWTGKKPTVAHLRVIGSRAFALDKRAGREKFQPTSKELVLVGYSEESKAYRLWDPSTRKIEKTRDVRFIEKPIKRTQPDEQSHEEDIILVEFTPKSVITVSEETDHVAEEIIEGEVRREPSTSIDPEMTSQVEDTAKSETSIHCKSEIKGSRKRERPPKRKKKTEAANTVIGEVNSDPCSIEEALNRPDAPEWETAIQREYDSLMSNQTWELSELPPGEKVIKNRWVLTTKRDNNGRIIQYKARLVVKGCSQRYGIDYEETFSPVVRHSNIRLMLALAVEYDLKVHQVDIVTAYLNGDIDNDLYMEQPEGFVDQSDAEKVCHLRKAIYGLKQAGKCWYEKLDATLQTLGLKEAYTDSCIYYKRCNDTILIVTVYVDDILIFSNDEEEIIQFKEQLAESFEVRDLRPARDCLKLDINQEEPDCISINQTSYIEQLLKEQGMMEVKGIGTPMDPKFKLTLEPPVPEEREEVDKQKYQCLIGSLLYLASLTRPDIAYTVSSLSSFNNHPNLQHWNVARRVLRYLSDTKDLKLQFTKTGKTLHAYVDADWGGNVDDRKSTTGCALFLGNAAVSWFAKKQPVVALSSTEAEYVAMATAAKEVIGTRNLLRELGFMDSIKEPTTIFNDNQSAHRLLEKPRHRSRTKHIDIKYHFLRDVSEKREVIVKYVPTEDMVADILTKGLPKPAHKKHANKLGLVKT